jgi:hypothetical protein
MTSGSVKSKREQHRCGMRSTSFAPALAPTAPPRHEPRRGGHSWPILRHHLLETSLVLPRVADILGGVLHIREIPTRILQIAPPEHPSCRPALPRTPIPVHQPRIVCTVSAQTRVIWPIIRRSVRQPSGSSRQSQRLVLLTTHNQQTETHTPRQDTTATTTQSHTLHDPFRGNT